TMIVTDQKISETTPKTFSTDTLTGCGSPGLKTVCSVYSGLVPISPKTTPRAPIASAARAEADRLTLTAPPRQHTEPTRANPNQQSRQPAAPQRLLRAKAERQALVV